MNATRERASGFGASNTSALVFGGLIPGNPRTAITEKWNGTAWTELNNLGTARSLMGSTKGPITSGLAFGGGTPDKTVATEEWSEPTLTIREFDLS